MKRRVVVRLCPGADLEAQDLPLQWCWQEEGAGPTGALVQGGTEELFDWWRQLKDEEQDEPVCLLVPGDLASCHRIDLNEHQRQHWQQAVPWLLEDSQATELEAAHIVSRLAADQSHARVGSISHSAIKSLVARFAETGMEVRWILPEAQFLVGQAGAVRLWIDGDAVYVAEPGGYGQLLDQEALGLVLSGLFTEPSIADGSLAEEAATDSASVQTLVVEGGGAADIARIGALIGMDLTTAEHNDAPHPLGFFLPGLATRARDSGLLDFRTGSYKCKRRSSRLWQQWRWAALAAGAWLGLEVLFNIGSGFYFLQRAEQIRQDNFATYQELRPEDTRVVDIRHNLTRFLRAADAGSSQAVFLDWINKLSFVSGQPVGKDVELMKIEFNESGRRLSLDVQAGSFDQLNLYLDALKVKGLQASMETGSQDSRGVLARLILKG